MEKDIEADLGISSETMNKAKINSLGNPYLVNASGNLQQALSSKTLQSPSKLCGSQLSGNENGVQFTTAYIQVKFLFFLWQIVWDDKFFRKTSAHVSCYL